MPFEQARIPVQKTEDFEALRSAIERALASAAVDNFYRRLEAKNVRVREFEKVVTRGLLEDVDPILAGGARRADQIYRSLTLSDQALMREFYLEHVERVDPKLRQKYQKVYRYY
jgi:hypothetical protein